MAIEPDEAIDSVKKIPHGIPMLVMVGEVEQPIPPGSAKKDFEAAKPPKIFVDRRGEATRIDVVFGSSWERCCPYSQMESI